MSRLSLGRGGSPGQLSPASFPRESVPVLQTSKIAPQQDEKATNASGSDPQGFDICQKPTTGGPVKLKQPLFGINREKRNSQRNIEEGLNGQVLRPGMVLLKHYLSLDSQVKIVNICRQLGVGSAGFYQPEYRSGEKMHLKMMCLGSSWDPNVAPNDVLPSMSPSICIANFYTKSGRLGLHQDKAESPESLRKGLPVVSFSIGDSAEFLYSERRDDASEKVLLESGDVLIFGGRSRNIFHGVSSVKPKTAPKSLLDQTHLREGRLNLTFREY
ncbi:Alpha-ketoglutarate-dependent dioxygenase AlkB [Linum perenne]